MRFGHIYQQHLIFQFPSLCGCTFAVFRSGILDDTPLFTFIRIKMSSEHCPDVKKSIEKK